VDDNYRADLPWHRLQGAGLRPVGSDSAPAAALRAAH